MDTRDALNRKLAEYAGFQTMKWIAHPDCPPRIVKTPEGIVGSMELIDFTSDIGACFEHLVKDNWGIVFYYKLNTFDVSITPTNSIMSYYGDGETRTIALCNAIERLIDHQ